MSQQRVEVLVLVKAAPQPSSQYGETVCVAGLRGPVDRPTWIRLYPVPFRYLDGERQFQKYQLIDIATRDAGGDKRPESRKIVADSIQIKQTLSRWAARTRWVERLQTPTMCSLVEAARADVNATSLAAVRPREPLELSFERNPGWTPEQLQRFQAFRSQGSLFDEVPLPLLQPPRFRVRLLYRCEAQACVPHEQTIIDWELTALQARYRTATDADLKTVITRNFFDIPFQAKREPLLFVGYQESIRRRASFTILGLYYPERADAEKGRTLF